MRSILMALFGAAVFSAALVAAGSAGAATTTWYVNKGATCSDTASGAGTATLPFCTISKGVAVAQAGQTVLVSSGTYQETVTFPRSGLSGSPITLTTAPNANVTVTNPSLGSYGIKGSSRSYVTVNGFNVGPTDVNGIYFSGGTGIIISGNHVTGAGVAQGNTTSRTGIKLSGVNGATVSGNTADNNSDAGIYLTSGATNVLVSGNEASGNARAFVGGARAAPGIDIRSSGNTITANYTHDNEDTGVQLYSGASGNVVSNNVIVNNGDHGIDVSNSASNAVVNNTVYHNCTSGINVEGSSGTGNTVDNNVTVDNAVYPAYQGISCSRKPGNIAVSDAAIGTTTVNHNLTWLTTAGTQYYYGARLTLAGFRSASGQASADVYADPKWVSATGGLTASSPAIGLADPTAPGYPATDYNGVSRSTHNASGAFVYAG
jgi:parallel beta-helix repeat protein